MLHGFKKLHFIMKNLVKILTKKKLKIAFAESCTGGLLASEITAISGASKVFSLGLVTYSNPAQTSSIITPKLFLYFLSK